MLVPVRPVPPLRPDDRHPLAPRDPGQPAQVPCRTAVLGRQRSRRGIRDERVKAEPENREPPTAIASQSWSHFTGPAALGRPSFRPPDNDGRCRAEHVVQLGSGRKAPLVEFIEHGMDKIGCES